MKRKRVAELTKFSFHGDELDVVTGEGTAHVVIKRVCEALELSYPAQLAKLKGDPSVGVAMIATPSSGGAQDTACLPIRALPLWLATVSPSKVKPQVRDKLIRYKQEAAEVLADHFLGRRGARSGTSTPELEAPGLTTRAILVTPEMAAEWMEHRNERNRQIREHLVDRYAADIRRGHWRTTHQGIAFGPADELIDGQHRLAAIMQTGIPVTLMVTFYASPGDADAAKLKCDTGKTKSLGDVFAMVGLSGRADGDKLAAVIKGMRAIDGHRGDSMSADEVRAFYLLNRASVDWAIAKLPPPEFSALHRSAFAYAHSVCPKEVDAFAEHIKAVDAPAGSPASTYIRAHVAGQFRATGGYGRREVTLKVLRILKAYISGEKGLSRLYATNEGLEFFRSRRDAAGLAADVKPRSQADDLRDALARQGFPRLRVERAIKQIGERVETEPLDALLAEAVELLSRRRARKARDGYEGEED